MKTARALALLFTLTVAAHAAAAEDATKLLRFPDIHGDRIVFVHGGDLWWAPVDGGRAIRLTSHPGLEVFPKFSPDGRWIAFTGQIDGDEQVYVIPADGGAPVQLTFYPARGPLPPRWGYDNQVYDWTADGEAVLFRSMRDGWDLSDTRLYTVPVDGGLPEALPMPVSGAGDLSPDGTRVVYSPLARDFRTWKRYQGGWAQDLWIFDLATSDVTRITEHERTDRDPMWIGDAVYFASDRDGTLDLYAYDVASGATRQLTDADPWDVRWPSDDGAGRIVYELGGELHLYDVSEGSSRPVPITVPSDALARRPVRQDASEQIEDFNLSPAGERALFTAWGDVFSVPAEHGAPRNLTRTPGAHEKWAEWSPDGRHVAFVSDRTGEEQVWVVDHQGLEEPRRLTDGVRGMLYAPRWSPTAEHLAFSDKEGRLWVVPAAGGEPILAADEARGQLFDYAWSPDGKWLAFSLSDVNGFRSIHLWNLLERRQTRVTSELWNSNGPAWDPDGEYLYFLSDRAFPPQIGSFEWNYVVDRETYVYALALRPDVEDPFGPRVDRIEVDGEEAEEGDEPKPESGKKGDEKSEEKDDDAPKPVVIELDGLAQRVSRAPLSADNYSGLVATATHLLVGRGTPFYYGRDAGREPALVGLDLEKREELTVAEGITGYALSSDGGKLLVSKRGGAYQLYDLPGAGGKPGEPKKVDVSGLAVDRVPAEEWVQIFDEVWRRFRDFFYVENMHGYDWQVLRDRYRPLLAHVHHRSDLNYLLGEMIAELNVSHAYVSGGQEHRTERPATALLGGRLELDPAAGRYRFAHVFPAHNEEPKYRNPLTAVGVDVGVGDYLLAVDGVELEAGDNPYRLLRHKRGQPVELTVAEAPRGERRTVVIDPLGSETDLVYLEWVLGNRAKVEELSDGRVGYIHLPDMGSDGLYEFVKWYYGQIRKPGLVIDVRNNGGGNISQMVINRLRNSVLAAGFTRTSDTASTYPWTAYYGHMATILNEGSASDGDIFPYMFREAGLGPLVGKRSWGGVVGITSHGQLIDGGSVNVPQFGEATLAGEWAIEGHGVDPDIEVDNPPKAVIEGRDPQLETAVEVVLEQIEAEPRVLPPWPAAPVKTE